jgi:hypothetical protein
VWLAEPTQVSLCMPSISLLGLRRVMVALHLVAPVSESYHKPHCASTMALADKGLEALCGSQRRGTVLSTNAHAVCPTDNGTVDRRVVRLGRAGLQPAGECRRAPGSAVTTDAWSPREFGTGTAPLGCTAARCPPVSIIAEAHHQPREARNPSTRTGFVASTLKAHPLARIARLVKLTQRFRPITLLQLPGLPHHRWHCFIRYPRHTG